MGFYVPPPGSGGGWQGKSSRVKFVERRYFEVQGERFSVGQLFTNGVVKNIVPRLGAFVDIGIPRGDAGRRDALLRNPPAGLSVNEVVAVKIESFRIAPHTRSGINIDLELVEKEAQKTPQEAALLAEFPPAVRAKWLVWGDRLSWGSQMTERKGGEPLWVLPDLTGSEISAVHPYARIFNTGIRRTDPDGLERDVYCEEYFALEIAPKILVALKSGQAFIPRAQSVREGRFDDHSRCSVVTGRDIAKRQYGYWIEAKDNLEGIYYHLSGLLIYPKYDLGTIHYVAEQKSPGSFKVRFTIEDINDTWTVADLIRAMARRSLLAEVVIP